MSNDLNAALDSSSIIAKKARESEDYALRLYQTLCNNEFVSTNAESTDTAYSYSWRFIGVIVADLMGNDKHWQHFYASGSEGRIDPEVLNDLHELGWRIL